MIPQGRRKARRIGQALGALLCAAGAVLPPSLAAAQDSASAIPAADWPCNEDHRSELAAVADWRGPAIGEETAGWREQRPLRRLAERAVAPQSLFDEATSMIDDFAAGLPADGGRNVTLAMLFQGVLVESNLHRRQILEDLATVVARRRLGTEALSATEAELGRLPADGGPGHEARRAELQERRVREARTLDRTGQETLFLCNRLQVLERKLRLLARAIASHLTP